MGRDCAHLLTSVLGQRPMTDLIPHMPRMSPREHIALMCSLIEQFPNDPLVGRMHLESMAHPDKYVYNKAFELTTTFEYESEEARVNRDWTRGKIKILELTEQQAQFVEGLLVRKTAELRKKTLKFLAAQPLQSVLASVNRLTRHGKTELRQAGLELLETLSNNHPAAPEVKEGIRQLLDHFVPRNPNEAQRFAGFQVPEAQPSLKDGLGLFDPDLFSPYTPPVWQERPYASSDLHNWLLKLDGLLLDHQDTLVSVTSWKWEGELQFPLSHFFKFHSCSDLNHQKVFPLAEVWQDWWEGRPHPQEHDLTHLEWMFDRLRGADAPKYAPHPLLRGLPLLTHLGSRVELIGCILKFLKREGVHPAGIDFLLDAFESHLSVVDLWAPVPAPTPDEPQHPQFHNRWHHIDYHQRLNWQDFKLADFNAQQLGRLWNLLLWMNRGVPRDVQVCLRAWQLGLASENDVMRVHISESAFAGVSRKPDPASPFHALRPLFMRLQDRILEVETTRNDPPTVATPLAQRLSSVLGARHTLKLLSLLGDASMTLKRVKKELQNSKRNVFSHLIRVSFPDPSDTPEEFSRLVKAHQLSEERLLELVVYAPQWAKMVEGHLGWAGLSSAVHWLHGHTRDEGTLADHRVRESWEAEISEHTSLTAEELVNGGVDVQWFRKTLAQLGEQRFAKLCKASRYLSGTGAHKRAELFAQTLLGGMPEVDLRAAVVQERHQDSVRALGLLPQLDQQSMLSIYRLMQAFLKESRQWGAQRQASEQRAVQMGLGNLARAAGFTDPERLMWQMETLEATHLNGLQVQQEGVALTLQVDLAGNASIHTERAGKTLKSIPAGLHKHPEVVSLLEARDRLREQKIRMREALEKAMIRGDHFEQAELFSLSVHPVLGPMLRSLVWLQGERDLVMVDGQGLMGVQGSVPLAGEACRIAHPHDLHSSGQWRSWQKHCFDQQIQQPFKQVFRELYLVTPAEQSLLESSRYTGQQVKVLQTLALLKTRQWIKVPDPGFQGQVYRKTFHGQDLSVWVEFQESHGTLLQGESLIMASVKFMVPAGWEPEPLPLAAVPPRLFSEAMRDLDLVVSVAHVGGVDPEATLSTLEMRVDLLRETTNLLRIDNVQLKGSQAWIAGHYGNYSVHLGSGTVLRQPGGAVCIVPVSTQSAGRIFLPFADPDPRAAEVISKVLMLAKDHEIQDPSILQQLM